MKREIKYNFTKLSKEKLEEKLIYACKNGKFDLVDYLLSSQDLKEKPDIHVNKDICFEYACGRGYLDIVQYLLTSNKIKDHIEIDTNNNEGLKRAIKENHIHIVDYLLTHPELKKKADIHVDNNFGLRTAVKQSNYELLTYLVSNEKLTERISIKAEEYIAVKLSCSLNNVKMLDFLHTSKKLNENITLQEIIEHGLNAAYINKNYEIFEYCIFSLQLKKKDIPKTYLQDSLIQKLFEIKNLNDKLEKDIPINDKENKKSKKIKL